MADIITTLHPEGISTDNLYPNIKKENLPAQLQPVADFALSEYEKTLQVWDEVWEVGDINNNGVDISSTTNIRSKNYIKVFPNTTYYFKAPKNVYLFYFDENKNFIRMVDFGVNNPFTTPSNCVYLRFRVNPSYGTTYNHDIIIAKGNQSVEYHPYNGEIMHAIDVEGVKLWENGDPNSNFSSNAITLSDTTKYKKLLVAYKDATGSTNAVNYATIENIVGTFGLLTLLQTYPSVVLGSRQFIIDSSTQVTIGSGFDGNSTQNNSLLIPVAIYGLQ